MENRRLASWDASLLLWYTDTFIPPSSTTREDYNMRKQQ